MIKQRPPTDADLELAAEIMARGSEPSAQCVFLRDKSLMFNEARTAFIMYGRIRCSWISAGDAVGPESDLAGLVGRFAREARADSSYPAFYKVGGDSLGAYLENGLLIGKTGESARIPTAGFGLEGSARRRLRRSAKAAAATGLRLEVISGADVTASMPALQRISDEWLRAKRTREKSFSLGYFRSDYIARFPVALVSGLDGPVAFASLWQSADRKEIEIDLMRYTEAAPSGTMHFLIAELVGWAGAHGYDYVGLGMVPLGGASPLDGKVGRWLPAFIRSYAQRFYNFEGLREFKQMFDPEWVPRYLVTSPGITRRVAIAHVAALSSGGVAGLIRK